MRSFLIAFLSVLPLFGIAYAADSVALTHPTLIQASTKIDTAIDKRLTNAGDATKLELQAKQQDIRATLVAIERAIKEKNKAEFSKLVVRFRSQYFALKTVLTRPESTPVTTAIAQAVSTAWPETPATILYYSDAFEGASTSNGNVFSQTYYSSARCDAPFNGLIQVISGKKSVIVKNNDRPNCKLHPDIIDVTRNAFSAIGKLSSGKLSGSVIALGTTNKSYYKRFIPTDTYTGLGIRLDTNIPNTYLPNETIRITGTELLGNESTLLYLQTPSGKDISIGQKKNKDSTFEYAYPLSEIGTYRLVVTSGLGFETNKYTDIVVLDPSLLTAKKLFPTDTGMQKLSRLSSERREFSDMRGVYIIRFPTNDWYTMTLTQGDNRAQYSGMGVIAIPSGALSKFDESKLMDISVTASRSSTPFSHDAYSSPELVYAEKVMPRPGYKTEASENIVATVEWDRLTVHGIIANGAKVHPEVVLTLPDGNVKKYPLDTQNIDTDKYLKRGVVFEKSITLDTYGQYLVEINYDNGFAAYNGPVSYGPILPILPSELDLVDKSISENTEWVRTQSLSFINAIRTKAWKKSLALDATLTNLATIKADDMADHDYLGHMDSAGQSIVGTAKRNNIRITGSVGENVAGGNVGAEVLLIGLINSGGHRANMLGDWTRVGIGYVVRDGKVYYVQVFGD